jgi:hypothetical protein
VGIALLALVLAACGGPQPVASQPAPAAEATITPAAATSAATTATAAPAIEESASATARGPIACDKLILPDEIKFIAGGQPAPLKEQVVPGASACEWKYTPQGASQESVFEVRLAAGAIDAWTAARKADLAKEPADLVVNSLDGLGDESYIWVSKPAGQWTVYGRRGNTTVVMRFPSGNIALATESQILDYADRLFTRFEG